MHSVTHGRTDGGFGHTYGHPHNCSCSGIGSSREFLQRSLGPRHSTWPYLAVTWPFSFVTLCHINRNSFIIIIIILMIRLLHVYIEINLFILTNFSTILTLMTHNLHTKITGDDLWGQFKTRDCVAFEREREFQTAGSMTVSAVDLKLILLPQGVIIRNWSNPRIVCGGIFKPILILQTLIGCSIHHFNL